MNPAFDVRIVDVHGHQVAPGTIGEIVCRARSSGCDEHGLRRAASDGEVDAHPEWFRTGDLGRLDDDGNLTYVDRVKDSLRRRGENVSSVEVETTVMGHPAVLEAAAVAVPSELGEDDILVVRHAATGREPRPRRLARLLRRTDAVLLRAAVLEVLDEIPKNVIGRVRKDVLRSRGLGDGAWDREEHGYVLSR